MAKYSFELKKQIVSEYLKVQGGYESLGKKYGVDNSIIRRWDNKDDSVKKSLFYVLSAM